MIDDNIIEVNVAGDGSAPISLKKDIPLFTKPCGKAFGSNYWTAPDSDTYDGVRLGRQKYQRWNSFVGKGEWAKGVSAYAKKYPKGEIGRAHV